MRIIIDNGHGLETPGKCSPAWPTIGQLLEWQYTRDIATRLQVLLREEGIPFHRLVPEHRDVPLWERTLRVNRIAKQYGPSDCLLVSIHVNASSNGKARGWEVHTSPGKTESDVYAGLFWEEAAKRLQDISPLRGDFADGDPDRDSNFAMLRDTLCPAVLTENLFMDHPDDCRFLLSEQGRQTMTEIHFAALRRICSGDAKLYKSLSSKLV